MLFPLPLVFPRGTPAARDHKSGSVSVETMNHNIRPLNEQVQNLLPTAPFATPTASGFGCADVGRLRERQAKCKERTGNGNGFGLTLNQQVVILGLEPSQSAASTTKHVVFRLNPSFSLWLMGFPALEWGRFSPGWKEWATLEKLLASYSERQTETESAGSGEPATP